MPKLQLTTKRLSARGLALVLLSFIAYISLGLPDGLLGVAWPSIRLDFSLPLDSLGALLIMATIGYLTASFFGGRILSRFKIGRLLAASSLAAGVALLGYALAPCWWTMVFAGFIAGLGAGAIDVALNTYVASYHGAGLMQLLHASYGVGATIGPVIMTIAITALNSWRWGYAVVGGLQLALAISFSLSVSLWEMQKSTSQKEKETVHLADYNTSMLETLRRPSVWLSICLFFIYMGIEYTLGTWTYTLLTESRGRAVGTSGLLDGRLLGNFYGRASDGRNICRQRPGAGHCGRRPVDRAVITDMFGIKYQQWVEYHSSDHHRVGNCPHYARPAFRYNGPGGGSLFRQYYWDTGLFNGCRCRGHLFDQRRYRPTLLTRSDPDLFNHSDGCVNTGLLFVLMRRQKKSITIKPPAKRGKKRNGCGNLRRRRHAPFYA